MNSEGKAEYNILTVQPLYQSKDKDKVIFSQARYAHNTNDRNTGNLGFGYRSLAFDNSLLFGINSFYDYEWPYNHQRVGAGFEVISNAIELRSNYYKGLSGWHSADSGFQERALDGVDVEFGSQMGHSN